MKTNTMADYCRQAIQVQDACNLSGILHSWVEMQDEIRKESNGSYARNHVNQLFAAKVIELCGMGFAELEQYSKAYDACINGAKKESVE